MQWGLALPRGFFFKATPVAPERVRAQKPSDATSGHKSGRIRCPRCQWQPSKADRWACECGCSWNTFDTRGLCPECGKQWLVTQCLSCQEFSLHEDWYADESDPRPTQS